MEFGRGTKGGKRETGEEAGVRDGWMGGWMDTMDISPGHGDPKPHESK